MKAEINVLPFVIVFSVVVISLLSVYFYSKTSKVEQSVSLIEYSNMVKIIEKKIQEYAFAKNIGSSQILNINTPEGMNSVCFVERNKEINRFSNPVLDIQLNLSFNNIYFEPKEYPAASLDAFGLEINPLCVQVFNNKINLKFESLGNKTKISAAEPSGVKQSKCQSLVYNGEKRIDVAFMGIGYGSTKALSDDAQLFISNIFKKIEPLKSNIDLFNFNVVPEPVKECEISSYIKCNNFEINKLASSCPHDYIIVLADRSKMLNLAFPVRSSAVSNIMKINTGDNQLVVAHEFGHAFGDLADEYVDDTYYSAAGISPETMANCDKISCKKWAGLGNTSCYKGCSLSGLYRATANSIMNLYFNEGGDVYGPVNERQFAVYFGVYR